MNNTKLRQNSKSFGKKQPKAASKTDLNHYSKKVNPSNPISNSEWKKKKVVDPSPPDKRSLLPVDRYHKNMLINVNEPHEFLNRYYMLNLKETTEYNKKTAEENMQIISGATEYLQTAKSFKKQPPKEKKTKKKLASLTKVIKVHKSEHPFKLEPDLGCFPKMQLVDIGRFKQIKIEQLVFGT